MIMVVAEAEAGLVVDMEADMGVDLEVDMAEDLAVDMAVADLEVVTAVVEAAQ